jgi:hypothetical protein
VKGSELAERQTCHSHRPLEAFSSTQGHFTVEPTGSRPWNRCRLPHRSGHRGRLQLSFGASRLIASQLWNTSPYDPATLLAAVAVIAGIGLLACYIPAARAVRADPVAALRLE